MTGDAVKFNLKYLIEDKDRHGNVRLYVRLPGKTKVRIRETFGTDQFLEAYKDAISGKAKALPVGKAAHGSFRWLCQLYYGSAAFTLLDISTQNWQRRALDSICLKHADKPIRLMESRHVRKIRDERKEHPAAANHRMKAMRKMFGWAVEEEHTDNDPTLGVRGIKYVKKGHIPWTAEDVAKFDKRHPLGTKPRLAKDLIRYTTGRREDAVRLGPQHTRKSRVRFTQAKNEHRNPVDINMPLHPKLAASIKAYGAKHLTFLVTEYGKPFTPAGFGNWFRVQCDLAGLPHLSAHGLRKGTLTEIAENDGTAHMIMSVGGHQTLEEVENYTRTANKAKLANKAMRKVK